MTSSDDRVFRFDPFTLNGATRTLSRSGTRLNIQPQAFVLLWYLVLNHRRAVSKDELVRVAWQGRAVEDNNLTVQIAKLRRLLGDSVEQRYIRTVHTFGYQFVASVAVEEPASALAPTSSPGHDDLRSHERVSERVRMLCFAAKRHLAQFTATSVQKAIELFELALGESPTHAPAYAGLAQAYVFLGSATSAIMSPVDVMPAARRAAEHAVELDEHLADAHAVLGLISYTFDWNVSEGRRQLQLALALDPQCASARMWSAFLAVNSGVGGEVAPQMSIARDAAPLSPMVAAAHGFYMSLLGEPEAGRRFGEYAVRMHPAYASAHSGLGFTYGQLGEQKRAVRSLRRAVAYDADATNLAYLAHALGQAGRKREARAPLDRLLRLANRQYVSPFLLALAWTGIDRQSKALDCLEQAVEGRDGWLVQLRTEPRLASLRSDTRFAGCLNAIGRA